MLEELDIDKGLVRGLQVLYQGLRVTLAGGSNFRDIAVGIGLKQGCPCSPLLFSVLFDRVA